MAGQKVTGVREAIATLRAIEPAVARQSVKDIKSAAEPARTALAAAAPSQPLSGMPPGPVRASTSYGGRSRGDGTLPLVRVQLRGPGWTVSSDMARKASPGESMVRNLTRKWGAASRWAWPTVERYRGAVDTAIAAACHTVEEQASRALRGR